MQINELFNMLAYGELSNHHIASAGDGTLALAKQPQIVHFANEALTRLYTKFLLKEKECTINLQEGVTLYHLTPEHAVSSINRGLADIAYIQDSKKEPFQDDVIRVLGVYSNHCVHRPLNDQNNCWSVNTPSFKTLQVNFTCLNEVLVVTYQAKHKTLDETEQEIELPVSLYGALTAFIAYKVYFNMNTPESQAISQGHLAMFNSICADSTESDAFNLSISGVNTRFNLGGWK